MESRVGLLGTPHEVEGPPVACLAPGLSKALMQPFDRAVQRLPRGGASGFGSARFRGPRPALLAPQRGRSWDTLLSSTRAGRPVRLDHRRATPQGRGSL